MSNGQGFGRVLKEQFSKQPRPDDSHVDRLVNCHSLIIVQGFSDISRRWEDVSPPQDCETGERMPCGSLEEAQEIVALYEPCLVNDAFSKMRIVKRKTTDRLIGS